MKLVIFGLTISSSWGNGHATIWRGLCRALIRHGHRVVFFERDVPYYAHTGIWTRSKGANWCLYSSWEEVLPQARQHLADADVGMVTSYCPDGVAATDLVLDSPVPVRTFYDLDTPVTLARLRQGESVSYIGPHGLRRVRSRPQLDRRRHDGSARTRPGRATRRPALRQRRPRRASARPQRGDLSRGPFLFGHLRRRSPGRARRPLYPTGPPHARSPLPHRRRPYPMEFPWTDNIYFVRHVPPPDHPAFYCSSRLTLNVTRRAMAEMGYCPSGRLFEAAACGTPILSDWWEGLDMFFQPGREILVARNTAQAVAALELSDGELVGIARAARERALTEHTADRRALELEAALSSSAPKGSEGREAELITET